MLNLTTDDTFAIYRLPDSATTYIILQEKNDFFLFNKSAVNNKGFVFYPFDVKTHSPLFIQADKIIKNPKFSFKSEKIDKSVDIIKTEYIKKAKIFIKKTENEFTKIVLSRKKSIKNDNLEIANIFQELNKKYPNAMIFLVNHPKTGTWMGATPEILIKNEGNKLKTMALAGTQLIKPDQKAIWQDKEIKEQKAVMDFVEETLKKHKIKYSSKGPYTKEVAKFKDGNLVHLATDYFAEKEGYFFGLITDLHPTPAVSGLPRRESIQFILENEGYDREYYTGFLGPVKEAFS